MREESARARRADASIRSSVDWSKADEAALVAGLLARNDFAQLEFIRRYEKLIDDRVAATIRRASGGLCTSETIEEIASAVETRVTSNRQTLRMFDPKRGTFADWLGRIAAQTTMARLHELTSLDEDDIDITDRTH